MKDIYQSTVGFSAPGFSASSTKREPRKAVARKKTFWSIFVFFGYISLFFLFLLCISVEWIVQNFSESSLVQHVSNSRETLFTSGNLVFSLFLPFQFLSYLFKIKVMNFGKGSQRECAWYVLHDYGLCHEQMWGPIVKHFVPTNWETMFRTRRFDSSVRS